MENKTIQPRSRLWSDARLRGEFDTLQLFRRDGSARAHVPLERGGQGPRSEPLATSYPQHSHGRGGGAQLVTDDAINFYRVDLIPERQRMDKQQAQNSLEYLIVKYVEDLEKRVELIDIVNDESLRSLPVRGVLEEARLSSEIMMADEDGKLVRELIFNFG